MSACQVRIVCIFEIRTGFLGHAHWTYRPRLVTEIETLLYLLESCGVDRLFFLVVFPCHHKVPSRCDLSDIAFSSNYLKSE